MRVRRAVFALAPLLLFSGGCEEKKTGPQSQSMTQVYDSLVNDLLEGMELDPQTMIRARMYDRTSGKLLDIQIERDGVMTSAASMQIEIDPGKDTVRLHAVDLITADPDSGVLIEEDEWISPAVDIGIDITTS
ncbi:MAG: hypothetical protein AAGB34_04465 [Planctomycetota bacterium]